MKALNKQALREAANAANIASWGKWESYKPHKGARGYEVKVGAKAVAQHCLKVDSAFIAAANPATVLALLDELETAEKRIAELEAKLDSADKLQDSAFRHGLQHGFSLGQTDNQAGFEECLSAYGTGKGE
ncbi:ead/Ea22-like family protein [Escherichia coli]|nr:ead/Ea22-like family protein [Escherichia coli]MDZ6793725.1 ead/Ea22-like family protein [Escherichia coli]HCW1504792.1 ead/Ea22-like family protein [Escherichia coli]